jgi:ubiquinone biosynthesis monooxygenase Coq7
MDTLLNTADRALRTLFAPHHSGRPYPAQKTSPPTLSPEERGLSGALMRVNHVGEVCAQALYIAQAQVCKTPALKAQFEAAAQDEVDHLAWTEQRLNELGDRPSLLNPLWFAGAYALGLLAGRFGDRVSLGFVVETEKQVAEHLQSHLKHLPEQDSASRQVVQQMKTDELIHARQASQAGAVELPAPVKGLMRAAAKVMTTVAHRV